MKAAAKSAPRAQKKRARPEMTHRHFDIGGVALVALGLIMVVALGTAQAGVVGAGLSGFFRTLFGNGAWAMPPCLILVGAALLRGRTPAVTQLTWAISLGFVALLGFIASPDPGGYFDPIALENSGGYLGAVVGWGMFSLFGVSANIALGAIALIAVILAINLPLREAIARGHQRAKDAVESIPRPPKRATVEDDKKKIEATERALKLIPRNAPAELVEQVVAPTAVAAPVSEPEKPVRRQPVIKDFAKTLPVDEPALPTEVPVPKEGYHLPPVSLLADPIVQPQRSGAEMQKNIETLEGTLGQFGIAGSVVEVATGPTVTRYEISLGPGVKVSKITALADNIAMDLAASNVRVEAPIPGKAAIGVEVPNRAPTMVTLRELCETKEFQNHGSRLLVALGKDVAGVNKYADLTRMPHLLIGGATNSGKSIGLATLITSLLMRNTPKDVRLVMIDPKRVELTLFDRIPHLMCPVIKDVKEAAGVLRAVWREMDRRFDLFSEGGVRNIDSWNAAASYNEKLPYIVVIIDELADLMIQCGAEVETVIVRLAQLARAVGIHLVIATQRPSVDVITGLIKANIPSRMAFSVATQIDSRTILDAKGAENLIGKGDMLFQPIDAMKPVRVQGCYVSEKEIDAICKFWREQQAPEYVLTAVDEGPAGPARDVNDDAPMDDDLWEEAVRYIVDRGEASTSNLQRKYRIGFQRASRLLDMMEERGVVGRRDGPRPREVLMTPMDVDSLFGTAPRYQIGGTLDDDPADEQA